jgi:hypothetical protein
MVSALSVSAAVLLAGALFPCAAHAATGTFFYRSAGGPWQELPNPDNDRCVFLRVDASQALNRTDHKALLYAGPNCDEAGIVTALVPGASWDGVLSTAKSVRFEFA